MRWTRSHPSSSTRSDWPVSWLDTNTCSVEVLLERYRVLSIKMEPAESQSNLKLDPSRLFMPRRHRQYIYTYRNAHNPSVLVKIKSKGMERLRCFSLYPDRTSAIIYHHSQHQSSYHTEKYAEGQDDNINWWNNKTALLYSKAYRSKTPTAPSIAKSISAVEKIVIWKWISIFADDRLKPKAFKNGH